MTDKDNPGLEGPAAELQSKIGDYSDIITRNREIADDTKRLEELKAMLPRINEEVERTGYVLSVELMTPSSTTTLYTREPDSEEWEPWCQMRLQGFPRKFLGDRLVLTGNVLLVADTRRRLAVDSIRNLEIHPPDDEVVQAATEQETAATLQRIGETATREERQPTVTRDRWGNDNIQT